MKCFPFSTGDRRSHNSKDNSSVLSRSSTRLSWARSLSVTSTSFDTTSRRSEFDFSGDNSRELSSDGVGFSDMLINRRANNLRVFKFSELKSATKGFNRTLVIGEGGFGCVYRGVVNAGDGNRWLDVAVKQLSRNGFQGHKEWINEVNFLGVVNHPNLVKLVGYCAEDDERGIQRLLVYELMRNKSLEDHLLGRVDSTLSWMRRLQIAQGAARGLAYLHEEMDFQVVGTIGYAAPEYLHTGRLTSKSDVWSFGVVLYELITGRRAVERNLPRNEQKLLEWVKPYISDSNKFHLIMDPCLEGDYFLKSAQKLASLANKCLTKSPKSRPKMSEVVEMIGKIINDLSPPKVETETETGPEIEPESQFVTEETEEPKEEIVPRKQDANGYNYMKKVFDFKELRNRSIGRLEWRYWPSGMVKHSA